MSDKTIINISKCWSKRNRHRSILQAIPNKDCHHSHLGGLVPALGAIPGAFPIVGAVPRLVQPYSTVHCTLLLQCEFETLQFVESQILWLDRLTSWLVPPPELHPLTNPRDLVLSPLGLEPLLDNQSRVTWKLALHCASKTISWMLSGWD